MQPEKGKKRIKNQPVLYDELKQRKTFSLTPSAWKKLQALSIYSGLSASEYLERLIREIDND
jgi:hypothetical protein